MHPHHQQLARCHQPHQQHCHVALAAWLTPICVRHRACLQQPQHNAGVLRRQVCTHVAQKDYYSSSSNLGVLQPVIEASPAGPLDDPYGMQRVTPDSFSSRGYYLDGSAIFGSLVLLVLLLALTFERILGLDRWVNQALQNWRESRQQQRRDEVIKARQALEESWDSGDDPK